MGRRRWIRWLVLAVFAGMIPLTGLTADVRIERQTQSKMMGVIGVFANMMGGQNAPKVQVSYIKGDYSRSESDGHATIIDLKKKRFILLDTRAKTYRVIPFEDMKKQIESAQQELEKSSEKLEKKQEEALKRWEVLVETERPGKEQTIAGIPAEELVLKVTVKRKGAALADSGGLVITAEQWLAKEHPGLKEVEEFGKRLERELGETVDLEQMKAGFFAILAQRYPQITEGMKKLQEEVRKTGKVVLRTVTRIEAVAPKSGGEEESSSGQMPDLSKLSKMFGQLGKNMVEPEEEKEGVTPLMEITEEVKSISTQPLDDALFKIPADFKEAHEQM